MNDEFQFAKKQFNEGILEASCSLINASIKDQWLISRKKKHVEIVVNKLKSIYGEQLIFNQDPFLIDQFGPRPIKAIIDTDLSSKELSVLKILNNRDFNEKSLAKYRYWFHVSFQFFLANSPRGSNSAGLIAEIFNNNSIVFKLLNDHIEKESNEELPVTIKTLQKQSERYFKRIGMPSNRNQLFEEIMDKH